MYALNLERNQIGAEGASKLAQYLEGSNVHTFDLGNNQIGDAGATQLAQHLKGSSVHTLYLNLKGNQISNATQQLLKEEYSHIHWEF